MASFNDIWTRLRQSGSPLPYLLIDSAGIQGGEERIPKHIFSRLECLFSGDLAVELADVGPYLGLLGSHDSDVAHVVEDLLTRQIGILVALKGMTPDGGEPTFSEVHRHFRKFNIVYGPENNPLFFRYYDPRVMNLMCHALSKAQFAKLSEPCASIVICSDGQWLDLMHTISPHATTAYAPNLAGSK